jgi:prepilin-type N-terminal cleavage/methylation domain-containing protein
MNKRFGKAQGGFTLVEIIVVLVILAILAAFTIPAMLGFVQDAREKQVYTEIREVALAAQSAYDEVYAEYGLDSTKQVIYIKGYKSKDPWDIAFTNKLKSLLNNDVKWDNINSVFSQNSSMYIYYTKDSIAYLYIKSSDGTVTIEKQ